MIFCICVREKSKGGIVSVTITFHKRRQTPGLVMSIAKLFVKIFNEDIFEKLNGELEQQNQQQQQDSKQQNGDAPKDEGEVELAEGRSSEAATISSVASQKPTAIRTEDMCLPE